jgi:microcystin-dependent protein
MSTGIKISELDSGGNILGNEEIPVARGAITVKIPASQFVVAASTVGDPRAFSLLGASTTSTGKVINVRSLSAIDGIYIENKNDTLFISGSGQNPIKTSFTGDGVTIAWAVNVANSSNTCNYRVTIDGVVQEPSVDYNINTTTSTITFTSPPPNLSKVVIVTNNLVRAFEPVIADKSLTNAKFAFDGGGLTLPSNPTANFHAATKQYVDSTNISGSVSKQYVDTSISSLSGTVDSKLTKFLPLSGGTMTGTLTLPSNPTSNLHAATKQYVDTNISSLSGTVDSKLTTFVPINGGTMTGSLTLNTDPTANLHAATKQYVDTRTSSSVSSTKFVPLSGGTMTGALTLNADPTTPLHAATKQYVDSNYITGAVTKQYVNTNISSLSGTVDSKFLPLSGGTMTGALTLNANPTASLHSATKQYVDTNISSLSGAVNSKFVPLSGGTMTGALTLNADPTTSLHSATKQYVDTNISSLSSTVNSKFNSKFLPLSGGTMAGALTLNADPTTSLHSATKQYVDTNISSLSGTVDSKFNSKFVPLSGGTMTGSLTLNANPTANLHSATKQYVDTNIISLSGTVDSKFNSKFVPLSGGTMTGSLTLNADPTSNLQSATKQYVDNFTSGVNGIAGNFTGAVVAFAVNTPPAGWLACDGAALSTTGQYAKLFSVIQYAHGGSGTVFNLPDLRGYFVRGVDAGRTFGSSQDDAFQGHYHTSASGTSTLYNITNWTVTYKYYYPNSGVFKAVQDLTADPAHPPSVTTTIPVTGPITDGINGTPRTAAETRPKNIALLYCIKY